MRTVDTNKISKSKPVSSSVSIQRTDFPVETEQKIIIIDDPVPSDEDEESKRQRLRVKVIQEIITTEEEYIRDCHIVQKVATSTSTFLFYTNLTSSLCLSLSLSVSLCLSQLFYNPLKTLQLLTNEELSLIFSNLRVILNVNQQLITDLKSQTPEVFLFYFIFLIFFLIFLKLGSSDWSNLLKSGSIPENVYSIL